MRWPQSAEELEREPRVVGLDYEHGAARVVTRVRHGRHLLRLELAAEPPALCLQLGDVLRPGWRFARWTPGSSQRARAYGPREVPIRVLRLTPVLDSDETARTGS